jgi:hypothetical protein
MELHVNKPTLSRIVSIILAALIALAAVFGYDIAVTQPRTQTEIIRAVKIWNSALTPAPNAAGAVVNCCVIK